MTTKYAADASRLEASRENAHPISRGREFTAAASTPKSRRKYVHPSQRSLPLDVLSRPGRSNHTITTEPSRAAFNK